jgi:DNA-binding NarL/FixJ family response regulator
MTERPRVIVADDHRVMLQSLVRLLTAECDIVGAANDGPGVVATALEKTPDVVVLDISMPGMSGIAAAAQLERRGSTARFVFVTMHHDREFVRESMEFGAAGFVVKDRLATDLMPAIRAVLGGEAFVSPTVAS